MGLKGWERGEGGWNQGVGQLLSGKGPEWMGIRHHEQNTKLPSKLGFPFLFFLLTRGFDYQFTVCFVNINKILCAG
jgi:hypothetical protein